MPLSLSLQKSLRIQSDVGWYIFSMRSGLDVLVLLLTHLTRFDPRPRLRSLWLLWYSSVHRAYKCLHGCVDARQSE